MANNFVENPHGQGAPTKAPRSFVQAPPEKTRSKPYDGFETSPASVVQGGRTAAETAANTPKQDAGNPLGAGSVGSPSKPFKVG